MVLSAQHALQQARVALRNVEARQATLERSVARFDRQATQFQLQLDASLSATAAEEARRELLVIEKGRRADADALERIRSGELEHARTMLRVAEERVSGGHRHG